MSNPKTKYSRQGKVKNVAFTLTESQHRRLSLYCSHKRISIADYFRECVDTDLNIDYLMGELGMTIEENELDKL